MKDVKPNGTNGGDFNSGAWRTRDLNELSGNTDFISLNANQFTLDAGTYIIEGSAPAFRVGEHKMRLYNVTDANISLDSTNARTTTSPVDYSNSFIMGFFTIVSQKVFEIQHICGVTFLEGGFGYSMGFDGNEIYTQVKITKIAN
ncbi:hypothetical protein OAQ99_03870 [Candidatus Kapabacteria bacterium]|nr:hypothetical protein [Candidatus Kapabacteria bacterium]